MTPAVAPGPCPPPTRSRWSAALLSCAAVAGGLIFVAWAKMETVQITYRVAELKAEEQELANDQRRLRAELAELRSPHALQALAPALGLVKPDKNQVFVVTDAPEALGEALEDASAARRPADPGPSAVDVDSAAAPAAAPEAASEAAPDDDVDPEAEIAEPPEVDPRAEAAEEGTP